jgi:hypothetical protein
MYFQRAVRTVKNAPPAAPGREVYREISPESSRTVLYVLPSSPLPLVEAAGLYARPPGGTVLKSTTIAADKSSAEWELIRWMHFSSRFGRWQRLHTRVQPYASK